MQELNQQSLPVASYVRCHTPSSQVVWKTSGPYLSYNAAFILASLQRRTRTDAGHPQKGVNPSPDWKGVYEYEYVYS